MSLGGATKGLLVFLTWTVTSFLCHYLAKAFLRSSLASMGQLFPACLVTLLQAVMCFVLTNVRVPSTGDGSGRTVLFLVKVVTHVSATLATNFSLASMQAASTMAVKLLEPLTSALMQWLVLGVPLSLTGLFSLPLVVGGAAVFVGDPGTGAEGNQNLGAVLALISNLLLAARNVAIKMEHERSGEAGASVHSSRLRSRRTLTATFVFTVLLVAGVHVTLGLGPPALLLAGSSLFHVAYSHVSTAVVLRYLTVVSHAVANIFKRVLVVLLLYAAGHRSATAWNFLGLVVSTAGLLVYALDKVRVSHGQGSKMSISMAGGRLRWVSGFMLASMLILVPLSLLGQHVSLLYRAQGVFFSSNPSLEQAVGRTFRRPFAPDLPVEVPEYLSRYKGPLTNKQLSELLHVDLVQNPLMADGISQGLHLTADIVAETQRLHFTVFSQVLAGYKYAFLLDMAAFENKGDPAITLGEVYLLRRLGIEIIYYCNFYACTNRNMDFAKNISQNYSNSELVILIHGGGNLIGYKQNDMLRKTFFSHFSNFQMVLFPQSVYIPEGNITKHLEFCEQMYRNQSNFTMVLRDRHSYFLAEKHFSGKPRFLMLPDAAFQIGMVQRFISPVYDILWLKRIDKETPGYKVPKIHGNIRVHVADWWAWKTPKGDNSMDTAAVMATNGMLFLQRGRVVISDRLHGHILCTLLNIPHVLIDNKQHKLTNYHNTWTKSSEVTLVAQNAEDALALAVELVRRLNDTLPPVAVYMQAPEEAPTPKSTPKPKGKATAKNKGKRDTTQKTNNVKAEAEKKTKEVKPSEAGKTVKEAKAGEAEKEKEAKAGEAEKKTEVKAGEEKKAAKEVKAREEKKAAKEVKAGETQKTAKEVKAGETQKTEEKAKTGKDTPPAPKPTKHT